jgi:hypothetical protein
MQKVTLAQFSTLPKAVAESKTVDLQCVKLDSIEALESILQLAEKKDLVMIAFDPPWTIDHTQCEPLAWLEFHRRLIALRQSHAKRPDVFDLNYHDEHELQMHAGIKVQLGTPEQAPLSSSLLEVMYASYLPEYARTYESLRLMAIAAPEVLPMIRCEFEGEQEALAVIRDTGCRLVHQAAESRDKSWESEKQDLQSENDLLLAQLHQVQEELERYYLRNKDLEGAINEAAQTVRQVRLEVVGNKSASQALVKRAVARRR